MMRLNRKLYVSRDKFESGLVKVVYLLVVILSLLVAHLLGLNHGISL